MVDFHVCLGKSVMKQQSPWKASETAAQMPNKQSTTTEYVN